MKKHTIILSFITILMFAYDALGQDSLTAAGKKRSIIPQIGYINEFAYSNLTYINSIGLETGLLLNKRLFVGYYAIVNTNAPGQVSLPEAPVNYKPNLNNIIILNSGLNLQYNTFPYQAIHFTGGLKIGKINIFDIGENAPKTKLQKVNYVTPHVNIELNVFKFMKMDFGVGYRFLANNNDFFKQNRVKGLIYDVSVQFGKFAKK